MTTILWYRQDLRVDDHPALLAAANDDVIPVYVFAPDEEGSWQPGGATRWWLHHSLVSLGARLEAMHSRLVLRRGPTIKALLDIAKSTGATRVVCTRRYEPFVDDEPIRVALAAKGIAFERHEGSLLFPLDDLRTGSNRPYQVYTPFSKALRVMEPPDRPRNAPDIRPPAQWPRSDAIESFELLPTVRWDAGFGAAWTPGGDGASALLRRFLAGRIETYATDRDRPDLDGTSRLSPHLHFGEISVRRVWYTVGDALRRRDDNAFTKEAEKFRAEVMWREFSHNILLHFPYTDSLPLRPEYGHFPWRTDAASLKAWQQGRTGYPIVDAGMRQLWSIGWMHNRVRMIVASFLVKDLLLPWQHGAKWFWNTLVDADLANNSLGWQWVAGSGADAAPYFRIFNPVLQGEKFDVDGAYVRRWVPELEKLPRAWIHKPWDAPPHVLATAGVKLGRTYPKPIVDHPVARDRALAALAVVSVSKDED